MIWKDKNIPKKLTTKRKETGDANLLVLKKLNY